MSSRAQVISPHQKGPPSTAATNTLGGPLARLDQMSIRKKLSLMAISNCAIVALIFLLVLLGLHTTDAARAYVTGESLWSKAQKEAVYKLNRYVATGNEQHYSDFQHQIGTILAYREARLEMDKANYSYTAVANGFVRGGLQASEVSKMIFLYRRFRKIEKLDHAIQIWIAGDRWIDKLNVVATDLHKHLQAGPLGDARKRSFLARIDEINNRLTPLERDFANTINQLASWCSTLLVVSLFLITCVLLAMGIWLALRVTGQIKHSLKALERGLAHFSQGDLSYQIPKLPNDELGELSISLNTAIRVGKESEHQQLMRAANLQNTIQELETHIARLKHRSHLSPNNMANLQLVKSLSVELRTPLLKFLTLTESFDASNLSASQQQELEAIVESSEDVRAVLNDAEDMARIESTGFRFSSSVFMLEDLVHNAFELIRPTAQSHNIELSVSSSELLHYFVEGDMKHLQQVLVQLLANTLKLSRDSSRVELHLSNLKAASEQLLIRFELHRSGQQASSPSKPSKDVIQGKRHYRGTDLGLAICHSLADRMNGKIGRDTNDNRPVTFWFEIPLKRAHPKNPQRPVALVPRKDSNIASA